MLFGLLIICPKYSHFLFLMIFINLRLVFIILSTSSLDLCSFHGILYIHLDFLVIVHFSYFECIPCYFCSSFDLHFTFTIFWCYTSWVDHFFHLFNCCSIQIYTNFGDSCFLLSTIDLVFFTLISIPYGLPLSFTVVKRFCNFCSSRASNNASLVYPRLLILCPPSVMPSISSISLNIFWVHRLNKLGDKTHPCLTPFFIWNSLCYAMLSSHHSSLFPVCFSDNV